MTATGSSAMFIVPGGVFAGRTTVTAVNPGGQAGSIPFQVLLVYTLDTAQGVQGSFGPNGGVLRTQSGGMTFTLTIPPFALDHEETITLTPVITMADLPLSHGLVAAAQFGPEGLRFHFPARLTIDVPAGLPPGVVLGFNMPDDGTGFHPYPSQVHGTTVEFLVFHFTLVGAGVPVPR